MRLNYFMYGVLILAVLPGEDHEPVPGIIQGLAVLNNVVDVFRSLTCWG